ncbi:hypothetical protein B0H13DRAFT_2350346 [Mycena leptocephala]|nr:hypothetical protein B0H13DRAFT_2350346 [Mycena leptocephala]
MSSITRRLSGRAVSPCLSLCIDSVSPVATAAVVMREMTATQLAYFKGVESIHLERGYYPVDDARRAIAQMIPLFPRVMIHPFSLLSTTRHSHTIRILPECLTGLLRWSHILINPPYH